MPMIFDSNQQIKRKKRKMKIKNFEPNEESKKHLNSPKNPVDESIIKRI